METCTGRQTRGGSSGTRANGASHRPRRRPGRQPALPRAHRRRPPPVHPRGVSPRWIGSRWTGSIRRGSKERGRPRITSSLASRTGHAPQAVPGLPAAVDGGASRRPHLMDPELLQSIHRLLSTARMAALGILREGAPFVSLTTTAPADDFTTFWLHLSRSCIPHAAYRGRSSSQPDDLGGS